MARTGEVCLVSGAAFEPIRVSDHVWHAHEAELRARDIGVLFRLAKRYAGASQNRIAAATGIPQSRVNALMNNRGGPVGNISVLERVADGLNLPDAARIALGLAPRLSRSRDRFSRTDSTAAGSATSDGSPRGGEAAERAEVRALLAHAAEITMGVPESGADQRWPDGEAIDTPLPSRVGRGDVEQIEQITAALRATDYLHGGGACREAASAQTRWVARLLDVPATEEVTRRLHLSLADLHNLAGWTSLDVGLHSPARGHFARALVHAHAGGQASLVANILYRTGRLHLDRSMPREALRFFQLGQIAAQDSGCTLTVSVLCANEAWACAVLGDRGQALASLRRAHDELTRADLASAAPWVRFFGEADLAGLAGLIHLELAEADQGGADVVTARGSLDRALALRGDDMVRSRVFEQIALATACLRDGDTEPGVRLGWAAATAAGQLQSARVRNRLRPLRAAASTSADSAVADLAHHLQNTRP